MFVAILQTGPNNYRFSLEFLYADFLQTGPNNYRFPLEIFNGVKSHKGFSNVQQNIKYSSAHTNKNKKKTFKKIEMRVTHINQERRS